MNWQRLMVILAVALPIVAGCNRPERSPFDRPRVDSRIEVNPADIASARDAPEPEITAETHFRAARFHESTRHFDLAIEQYRLAIRADNTYTPAYDRLGLVLGYLGRPDEAERTLRKALMLQPGSSAIRNNLGFLFVLQERWPLAEREFRRALQMNPQFDRAHVNLGVALAAQSRFDEALAEFRRVLPEPDAQYNLGLAYCVAKRYEDGRQAFEQVLALNPNFPAARKQLERLPFTRITKGLSEEKTRPTGSPDPTGGDATGDSFNALVTAVTVPVPLSDFEQDLGDEPAPARKRVSLERSDHKDNEPPESATPSAVNTPGDFNGDGRVDMNDFAQFQKCLAEGVPVSQACRAVDFDDDGDVDLIDYFEFQASVSQP